jgi:cytoskeleton protein RodZ
MSDSEPPSPPPPVQKAPETLGQILRSARLAQDLTIEQLATELRIEAKQLTALEDNRFERIGVPVFIKGYLKQYGLRLGLDVPDLLALYYKQTTLAEVEIQPRRTIKLRDERQIASWILAAIVLLALAGLAAWWWSGGTFGAVSGSRSAPATTTSPAAEPAEPAAPPAAAPALIPLERTLPAVDTSAADPPAAEPGEQPAQPGELPAATAFQAPDEGDDTEPAPAASIPLELTFDEESWAEITDARGERLLFGLSAAGRNVTVRGEPPFAIVLGNADAVHLTVDGEPYAIPRGRQGNLARFDVDVASD